MHLPYDAAHGGHERITCGKRIQLPHTRLPARSGAGWPDRARLVLLCHHLQDERSVDACWPLHEDLALVAAVPDDDGRVCGKPAHLMAQLALLNERLMRQVPALIC